PLLAKTAANGEPDTLEVFVLYVEFADETQGGSSDDPGTTGKGTFGSDTRYTDYTLDPNGPTLRQSAYYLTKRFELMQDYFGKVSAGQVVMEPRLFPPPAGDSIMAPLHLSTRMASYNPAIEDKEAKQKTSEF